MFLSLLPPLLFFLLASFHQTNWKESKLSHTPFECGMESISSKRVNLHLHFFFLAILFVVFDLEIAVIIPLTLTPISSSVWSFLWTVIFFILFLGVVFEMEMNSLEWKE